MTNLLTAIIILQALDAATTIYALRKRGLVEGNRIMRKWFDLVGLIPGMILIKVAFVGWIWWAAPQVPVEVLYLVIAGYLWVACNNIKMIRSTP